MGLDMYIYRCEKPELQPSNVYDREELLENGYRMTKDVIDIDPLYEPIIPYAVRVPVVTEYYDMEKIRKDFEMSEQGHINCVLDDGIMIRDDKTKKNARVTLEDIETKYTIKKEEICFVWKLVEVKYWRKEYDIQDFFYSKFPIENMKYQKITLETIEELMEMFPEEIICVDDLDEESALFYWEWY